MNNSRRTFLTSTLAASAATAVSTISLRAAAPAGREYYDLRAYRLRPGTAPSVLDGYFEKALLPALDRRGIKSVGVFTELEVNKTDQTSVAKPDTPVWVLIPYATLDSFVTVSAEINLIRPCRKRAPIPPGAESRPGLRTHRQLAAAGLQRPPRYDPA